MELNEVTRKLPKHLLQFVVDQPYNEYTAVDHAVWRYVMRQNFFHLKKVAHESYVQGLKMAGVEIDRIPTMYGMNRILKEIGWAAVAVDGFIPPGAFMEFTKYNVLVIAADIRTIEHIEYTPAPDIIHESAGHAPILAVPEFAEYLKYIGEVGCMAFSSAKDVELYEAIRHLSIIKEDPATREDAVVDAERAIEHIQSNMGAPSEMALIRNLHWWTVEYGLIGTVDNFRLYGAGLLSSIGEGMSCLDKKVKKIPYTIEAMHCNYDITKPQPQLFVTPDFAHLTSVLEQFRKTMAWTTGGLSAIQKAISSQQTATLVYSSGLQVTGTFSSVNSDAGDPVFFKTTGPTALAFGERQLSGYDKNRFPGGFLSPVGRITAAPYALEDFSVDDLERAGIITDRQVVITFESGLIVEGSVVDSTRSKEGKIILIRFKGGIIRYDGKVLIEASSLCIGVGSVVKSVYAGAADVEAFEPTASVPHEKMHKIHHDDKAIGLQMLYKRVRAAREGGKNVAEMDQIWKELQSKYPGDWLLPLEIIEILLSVENNTGKALEIEETLEKRREQEPHLYNLITNGLSLLPVKNHKIR